MNRYGAPALFGVLIVLFGPSCPAKECRYISAQERWPIKTSIPARAVLADATVVDVQSVIDLPNPQLTKAQRSALRRSRLRGGVQLGGHTFHEGDIVTVEGYFYGTHCEHDGDYHMEIGSTVKRTDRGCLIVEIPDPAQAAGTELRQAVTAARSVLDSESRDWKARHRRVQVTGQLFLDESHAESKSDGGRRGTGYCAKHLWEIHPVTGITAVGETADHQHGHPPGGRRTAG